MSMIRIAALAIIAALTLPAQAAPDITGQWQGVLRAEKDYRVLLKIAKSGTALKATFYAIDEDADPMTEGAVVFDGTTVKVPSRWSSYNAKLNAKGDAMTGTMYQGVPVPLNLARPQPKDVWQIPKPKPDTSPHKSQMVTVEKGVRLEVLDWGGSGKPLIFIPGLGANAHVFDKFATRLTGKYHVYGITRRGFGKSDKPEPTVSNYAGEKLADDVLKVMDVLKLTRPVLAGWSIGGAELSAIGTQHPEKVAGLVYLDAGYAYAFYQPASPQGTANINMGVNELRDRANRLNRENDPKIAVRQIDEMLNSLDGLQADLRAARKTTAGQPPPPPDAPPADVKKMEPSDAVWAGIAKYGSPKAPMLVIYAHPQKIAATAPAGLKAMYADWERRSAAMIKGFASGNPKARIVVIPQADHDVFNSNPDQVEREMKTFIDGLR
jgi:non-heme chloroperoxidase